MPPGPRLGRRLELAEWRPTCGGQTAASKLVSSSLAASWQAGKLAGWLAGELASLPAAGPGNRRTCCAGCTPLDAPVELSLASARRTQCSPLQEARELTSVRFRLSPFLLLRRFPPCRPAFSPANTLQEAPVRLCVRPLPHCGAAGPPLEGQLEAPLGRQARGLAQGDSGRNAV